jgi:signal transduction histidine kinase/ActR/RegA family two-component response regulator
VASNDRIHTLLVRQLKRCFGSLDEVPESCRALIGVVNDAYVQADNDRRMIERSLELSSEELIDANASLRKAVAALQTAHGEMESRVVERTRALDAANEDLRQAQKMEAVGKLAGGIAHDFNNLLTVITGCTELVLDNCEAKDPDRADLEEIRRATERAAALTYQLLAFSRKQVLDPKTIDLNEVVLGIQSMLARVIREDITLLVDVSPKPAWVKLDPNQIEQVILNLVLNSRDALPNGGRIHVDVAHVAREAGNTPEGECVQLRVRDDGIGMAPDVRDHVFEPFFTTKRGKGSGMGLATVHGIVHQSDGVISVESTPFEGTIFTMFFPASTSLSGRQEAAETEVESGNKETVLLVEDQQPVRRVISTMLGRHGYRVIEAATPTEARLIFERRASEIDLLITDVIMPEMNGPTLARRLLTERPELPVLFISGHTDLDSAGLGLDKPGVAFLSKPLQSATLTTKVRELLKGSTALPDRPN